LKEFTTGFPSEMKGLAINNSDTIRSVHNSFTPPQPFVPEEKQQDSQSGDAFHFVAYLPAGNDGGVYELDGLKPGPIRIGECSPLCENLSQQQQQDDDAWLDIVARVIEKRIAKYAAAEVRFNLMAVVKSRLDLYTEQLSVAEQMCRRIETKLTSAAAIEEEEEEEAEENYIINDKNTSVEELPSDRDTLQSLLIQTQDEIDRLKMALQGEKEKRAHWEEENLRRRTDYTPVIFQSLKALAEAGLLQGLVDKAKKKQEDEEKKGGGEKQ
jgi:ubiquitin carboxyl-terminal hydrolase L5